MKTGSRLIVALDTPDLRQAKLWANQISPHCGLLKLGLEFFSAHGPEGVRSVTERPVFLDLKLHDIPNTVGGAVRALLSIEPAMITVHAAGGAAMVSAARRAAGEAEDRPLILGVTVLTSLDDTELHETGVADGTTEQVLRLGKLALAAGADGLVCSAHELTALRASFGTGAILVVPGIRPLGSPTGDQARVVTPQAALDAGADWIVVGRPITAASDPAAAAAAIAA